MVVVSVTVFRLVGEVGFGGYSGAVVLVSENDFNVCLVRGLILVTFGGLVMQFNFLAGCGFTILDVVHFLFSFKVPFLVVFITSFLPFEGLGGLLLRVG